jgi:hypothetical protein
MADDLEDLGGFEIFPIEPNWVSKPKLDLELGKIIVKYIGTSAQLNTFTDDVPEAWKLGFNPIKSEEYDLIDFFVNRYGRNGGFWLKVPAREFTLYSTALSGSTELRVEKNYAWRNYQDRERIWIDMHTGDIITRKIIDTTEETDYLALDLNVSLDRDVTLTNHFKICKLLFCRFDEDMLKFDCESNLMSGTQLSVRELVKEYPS